MLGVELLGHRVRICLNVYIELNKKLPVYQSGFLLGSLKNVPTPKDPHNYLIWKKCLCRYDYIKYLELGWFSWIIEMGPKCYHKHPCKREAEWNWHTYQETEMWTLNREIWRCWPWILEWWCHEPWTSQSKLLSMKTKASVHTVFKYIFFFISDSYFSINYFSGVVFYNSHKYLMKKYCLWLIHWEMALKETKAFSKVTLYQI